MIKSLTDENILLLIAIFCHYYFQQNLLDNKNNLLGKGRLLSAGCWLSSWFVLYKMLSRGGNPDPWEAVDIIDTEVSPGISSPSVCFIGIGIEK